MGSTGEVYDRILFAVAAAWNLGAAAALILNPDFMLARLSINDAAARLLARSFASSVTTWGIGYAQMDLMSGDKEHLTEGYYNFQLTERLRLSGTLQHVLDRQGDKFGYLQPGIRLQASF